MAKEIGDLVFFFEGDPVNGNPNRCRIGYTVLNRKIGVYQGCYIIESGWDNTLQNFVDNAYSEIKKLEGVL